MLSMLISDWQMQFVSHSLFEPLAAVPGHAVDLLLLHHDMPHLLAVDHPFILGRTPFLQVQSCERIHQLLNCGGKAEEGSGDLPERAVDLVGCIHGRPNGGGDDGLSEDQRVVEEFLLEVVARAEAGRSGPIDAPPREEPSHKLHDPFGVVEAFIQVLQQWSQQQHSRVGSGGQQGQLDANGPAETVPAEEYFRLILEPSNYVIDECLRFPCALRQRKNHSSIRAARFAEVLLVEGVHVDLAIGLRDLVGKVAKGAPVTVDSVNEDQNSLGGGGLLNTVEVQLSPHEIPLSGKWLFVGERRGNGELLDLQDFFDVL